MKNKRLFIALMSALLIVCGYAGFSFGENFHVNDSLRTCQGPDRIPGGIVIKFKPGTKGNDIAALHARHDVSELSTSRYSGVKRLKISPRKSIDEIVAIYSRNPNVEYAEPNFIVHAQLQPDDPYYPSYQ
ncbi:MAG: hypothetical protein J7K75_11675 [Desulfuromonas sp.]|nr:hypothetical protein [Desulfuromonas sp.]